jgi:hypothetical protein
LPIDRVSGGFADLGGRAEGASGGEVLLAGGDVKLTWTATDALGIPSVKLEITRNNGGVWETIPASAPNTGSYVWRVSRPASQTNSARLRVTAVDVAGLHGIDLSNSGFSIYAPPTSVDPAASAFALTQIRPNPAASLPVRIEYSVKWETKVRISIVDVQGRVVSELANGVMPAGQHEVVWTHGTATPAGLYFVILKAAGQSYRRRLVIVG